MNIQNEPVYITETNANKFLLAYLRKEYSSNLYQSIDQRICEYFKRNKSKHFDKFLSGKKLKLNQFERMMRDQRVMRSKLKDRIQYLELNWLNANINASAFFLTDSDSDDVPTKFDDTKFKGFYTELTGIYLEDNLYNSSLLNARITFHCVARYMQRKHTIDIQSVIETVARDSLLITAWSLAELKMFKKDVSYRIRTENGVYVVTGNGFERVDDGITLMTFYPYDSDIEDKIDVDLSNKSLIDEDILDALTSMSKFQGKRD